MRGRHEYRAVVSKMTQTGLVLLHYVYWYWFFCHLADLSVNRFPVFEPKWHFEDQLVLGLCCAGVKDVWSSGLECTECCLVLVADVINYGFPPSKRFASAFVACSLVKQSCVVGTQWNVILSKVLFPFSMPSILCYLLSCFSFLIRNGIYSLLLLLLRNLFRMAICGWTNLYFVRIQSFLQMRMN